MKNLKKLYAFLRPYKTMVLVLQFFVVVSCVMTILMPMFEGNIITQLFDDVKNIANQVPNAHIQVDVIVRILIILAVIYVISFGSRVFVRFLVARVISKTIFDIRQTVKEKMTQIPVSYYDKHTIGDLMARMSTDVDAISNGLNLSFVEMFNAVLMITFSAIMLFVINVELAFVGVSLIPLSYIFSRVIVKISQKYFKKQQRAQGALQGITQERLTGFNEVKIFRHERQSIKDFTKVNEDLRRDSFKASSISGLMYTSVSFLTYAVIALTIYFGMLKVIEGVLLVGVLQAFTRYIWMINQPLAQLSQLSSGIQSGFAAMDRVFDFLDEKVEVQTLEHPKSLDHAQGRITFTNVRFGYGDKAVINDLNIDIAPGSLVAIVGPTGAGKTTIANLLMRFYDVNAGSISIDGIDIRDVNRDDLRQIYGMVLQDPWLFNGSVRDNIAYGTGNPTDEAIIEVCKRARVHHFIQTLPQGYDTIINEESSNISIGEKQLITIARVMLSDPTILILDEATSSVDTRMDAMIQKTLGDLMSNRTSVVIAHRLSTIRNADIILVVKDGDIIEQGNHDTLIHENGFYADLYYSQFADYDED